MAGPTIYLNIFTFFFYAIIILVIIIAITDWAKAIQIKFECCMSKTYHL